MEQAITRGTSNINVINTLSPKKPSEELELEGCVELARAILEQTCRDYVRSIKLIRKYRGIKNKTKQQQNEYLSAQREKMECEQFYYSEMFTILTMGMVTMGPEEVMREIRRRHGLEK